MIEIEHLTKKYGNHTAVNDLNLTIEPGRIYGFLGPNGAGKSTTMNIITGYISSTSGTVTVDGSEILENPRETKLKIGYLPEIPPLYPDMTVRKYLEFMFDLKKVRLPKKEHIEEIMRLVQISDKDGRLIKTASSAALGVFLLHTTVWNWLIAPLAGLLSPLPQSFAWLNVLGSALFITLLCIPVDLARGWLFKKLHVRAFADNIQARFFSLCEKITEKAE